MTSRSRQATIGFLTRVDGTILLGSGSPENRPRTANLKVRMGGIAERATWGDRFVLEPEA